MTPTPCPTTEAAAHQHFNAQRTGDAQATNVAALRLAWAKSITARPYSLAAHLAAEAAYRTAMRGTTEGQCSGLAAMSRAA